MRLASALLIATLVATIGAISMTQVITHLVTVKAATVDLGQWLSLTIVMVGLFSSAIGGLFVPRRHRTSIRIGHPPTAAQPK